MSTPGAPGVSRREAEVLAAIGAHLTNVEIAATLRISVRTVESHVSSLLRKFGVADRRTLARLAPPTASAGRGAGVAGLPPRRTSFVGRAHERDGLLAGLGTSPLVTLVGPGGVGKTRLAVEVAAAAGSRFAAGAFVDLVPVRDGFVAQAVAAALGVGEAPDRPFDAAVAERLGAGPALLVLDNCEHVLDATATFVARLLAASPGTTVLATSRERLGVPGERSVPVGPLPLSSDAEALFADRARAADPTWSPDPAAVARICARLDGMPLAIELAAARGAALGTPGLLAALEDALRALTGGRGRDERHRSLRDVIGWSHDLLDGEERALFRRLAIFAGAFDVDAAAAVAGRPGPIAAPEPASRGATADLLGRLAGKSLLAHDGGRWRLLETIRAFARERLDASGERDTVTALHLRWAAATATRLGAALSAAPVPAESADVAGRTEEWAAGFDAVADDLRAALAATPPAPDEMAHRLARGLARLAYARRFPRESLRHFRAAAERAPTPAAAADDLRVAADAVYAIGHASQAYDLLRESAARAREAGDGGAVAVALARAVVTATRFPSGFPAPVPRDRLDALLAEASAADSGAAGAHLAAARVWHTPPGTPAPDPAMAGVALAAARSTGDPALISGALDALGTLAARAGRLREAHRLSRERLDLLPLMDRRQPGYAAEILDLFHVAWLSAFAAGDLPAALATAEAIRRDDLLGAHPYRATSKLVPALVLTGRFAEALEHALSMWDGWERLGGPTAAWMSPGVSSVALAHGLRGDRDGYTLWRARAVRATGVANPELARYNASFAAFVEARVAVEWRPPAGAAAAIVERCFGDFPVGWHETYARAAGAELAAVAGLPDAAERLAAAAPAGDENDWAAACLARTAGRVSGDSAALAAAVAGWERIDARFERACTLRLIPERADEGRRAASVYSGPI